MTTTALGTVARREPVAASRTLLELAFHCGLGFLLFGDYLGLSASRLLTGEPGGWTSCVVVVQLGVVGLACMLGHLRDLLRVTEVLWFAALSVVFGLHVVMLQIAGDGLSEYGADKVLAWFVLCWPALLCGIAAGRSKLPPGGALLAVFSGPLLLGSVLAVLADPELITILYHRHLYLHFGVLVQPAHQGLALSLAKLGLGCYAWLLVQGRTSRQRAAPAVGLILCFALIIMSGARGYTLGIMASILVLWWLGRGPFLIAVAPLALGLWAFQQYSSEEVLDRFDPTETLQSLAYQERVYAWDLAWRSFLERPLLGFGPGGFADLDNWGSRSYAHNIFLEFACELGVLGLGCFVALMVTTTLRIWRLRKERLDGGRAFAFGLFAFAAVGTLSVGDVIRNYFLFFAMGLVIAASRPARQSSGSTSCAR